MLIRLAQQAVLQAIVKEVAHVEEEHVNHPAASLLAWAMM